MTTQDDRAIPQDVIDDAKAWLCSQEGNDAFCEAMAQVDKMKNELNQARQVTVGQMHTPFIPFLSKFAHERQLKPVLADDLIGRKEKALAYFQKLIDEPHNNEDTESLKETMEYLNSIPAISNSGEAVGLVYNGQDGYGASLIGGLKHNTKLYTAPPQPQSVKAALKAAANICVNNVYKDKDTNEAGEYVLGYIDAADTFATAIRALITDKKEG